MRGGEVDSEAGSWGQAEDVLLGNEGPSGDLFFRQRAVTLGWWTGTKDICFLGNKVSECDTYFQRSLPRRGSICNPHKGACELG